METDYYKILGLPPMASTSEIKVRYKQLAKMHHPDLSGDTNTMSLINRAYSVLADPKLRFNYNRSLIQPSPSLTVKKKQPSNMQSKAKTAAFAAQYKSQLKSESILSIFFNPIGIFTLLVAILLFISIARSSSLVQLNSTAKPSGNTALNNGSATTISKKSNTTNHPSKSTKQHLTSSQNTSSGSISSQSCSSVLAGTTQQTALLEQKIYAIEKQLTHISNTKRYGNYWTDTYSTPTYSSQYVTLDNQLTQYETALSNEQTSHTTC